MEYVKASLPLLAASSQMPFYATTKKPGGAKPTDKGTGKPTG
jgi:hypothetical protein